MVLCASAELVAVAVLFWGVWPLIPPLLGELLGYCGGALCWPAMKPEPIGGMGWGDEVGCVGLSVPVFPSGLFGGMAPGIALGATGAFATWSLLTMLRFGAAEWATCST